MNYDELVHEIKFLAESVRASRARRKSCTSLPITGRALAAVRSGERVKVQTLQGREDQSHLS